MFCNRIANPEDLHVSFETARSRAISGGDLLVSFETAGSRAISGGDLLASFEIAGSFGSPLRLKSPDLLGARFVSYRRIFWGPASFHIAGSFLGPASFHIAGSVGGPLRFISLDLLGARFVSYRQL